MRRLTLILTTMLVWLSTGCTSSDRDYVRNHIVHVDSSRQLPTAAQPVILPDSPLHHDNSP